MAVTSLAVSDASAMAAGADVDDLVVLVLVPVPVPVPAELRPVPTSAPEPRAELVVVFGAVPVVREVLLVSMVRDVGVDGDEVEPACGR